MTQREESLFSEFLLVLNNTDTDTQMSNLVSITQSGMSWDVYLARFMFKKLS